MRLHRPRDLLVGLAFAALGAFVVIEAAGLPSMPGMGVGSGLFPMITGAGMILFGLALALQGFAPGAAAASPVGAPDDSAGAGAAPAAPRLDVAFAAVVLVGLVALILLVRPAGFLLAAGVFGAVVARVGGASLLGALLFGAAASAGLYWVFVYGLGVPLPHGVLSF